MVCTCDIEEISVYSPSESFPGFMFPFLRNIVLSDRYSALQIAICVLGCFNCLTITSSIPTAFPFFIGLIPFLYSLRWMDTQLIHLL